MTSRWDLVVRELLDEARRAAGGGAALAKALHVARVGPEAGAYSESAVSNWIKGRTRPPGDVVLAAAGLHNLSIDRRLDLPTSTPAGGPHGPSRDLEQLRSAFDRLEALVIDRLNPPMQTHRPLKDLVAVYATRAEAQAALPLVRTLAGAQHVDVMGLSLNAICQGVSDVVLVELIESGLHLRCLYLDPAGEHVRRREDEEGVPQGHLADITRTNMHALLRIRKQLSEEAARRLSVRTYDAVLRFNITLVDNHVAMVQPYLNGSRGIDSPTFHIEMREDEPHGLYPVFDQIWADSWGRGRHV